MQNMLNQFQYAEYALPCLLMSHRNGLQWRPSGPGPMHLPDPRDPGPGVEMAATAAGPGRDRRRDSWPARAITQ